MILVAMEDVDRFCRKGDEVTDITEESKPDITLGNATDRLLKNKIGQRIIVDRVRYKRFFEPTTKTEDESGPTGSGEEKPE